ncbi:MAG: hypothetical protein UX58_C0003G0131 [Candidatus Wolfebacteria bacterium GW2011_GWB2_46_69]|uniref:Uncharacterized protein n=1 Tax=Candidatus Wolfebacteria bacterium GW2011_GWA2_47_9b TaxID=1619005 RepID=A0A0G1U6M5_9BACT|nr:MAG: hypothetical protein UX58_C0003G0131 [Candidatus Wolfebacteria bacterium GW2011_GWB2_46_69]KKU53829.1 MAG: hypothetical protein UX76_C0009G0019 [Candidatus Wolfebacteria bacterium GW2011_GWC1_47_103]KKU72975.1 MAG: hypothetical protein UX96_C0011G0024 [Candidatus Wolfebacteria bacterium GW2011_GWB1_47_243]KKU89776.1 MAG: hypothetical protein UY19_C0009G0025 [Candidatus Wolfebacteria bacterium GW2011_GWA2_47_9b]
MTLRKLKLWFDSTQGHIKEYPGQSAWVFFYVSWDRTSGAMVQLSPPPSTAERSGEVRSGCHTGAHTIEMPCIMRGISICGGEGDYFCVQ